MQTLRTVKDAFEAEAGLLPDGWFCVARLLRDEDAEHLEVLDHENCRPRSGRTEAEWARAVANLPRRLLAVVDRGGRVNESLLAEAERIEGPAAAGGPEPCAAWAERSAGTWRLMLWTSEAPRVLAESPHSMRAPAVARAGGRILTAWEHDDQGVAHVSVLDGSGEPVATLRGRRPRLCGLPGGEALLLVEMTDRPGQVRLMGLEIAPSGRVGGSLLPFPAVEDFCFNADLAAGPDAAVYVAHESCPCWGWDERVGLHRDLWLWTWRPGQRSPLPAAGSWSGRLAFRLGAYNDLTMFNYLPIKPRVALVEGRPCVVFRRFRFMGHKGFGWDSCAAHWTGERWTPPARISPNPGPPDARPAVLAEGRRLTAFFPCCRHAPKLTFDGLPTDRKARSCHDFRVEVIRLDADESLPMPETPRGHEAVYVLPPSLPPVAPAPPDLTDPPRGLSLVWGDLHAHSAYSKCMSGNDGLPEDVLRFERDVLGCRVLCLTEHVEYMGCPEHTHVLDRLEAEAGDGCIPLYAVEWAKAPAHHTNFYAVDRKVFDGLRGILLACHHLTAVYERVKAELPPGSVLAIRHTHGRNDGDFGVSGPRTTETHDPVMEPAMEAMQTRGNMMMEALRGLPPFPSNFLNAGARVGLVAGSDHCRGGGLNRFCLTGFWVTEPSAAAVFDAIRGRRTIACANGKVAVWACTGGKAMGEAVEVFGPVRVQAQFASARPVKRACLLRDGQPLPWVEVGAETARIELADEPPAGRHWYSVTAEADSIPGRLPALVHASPIFAHCR